MTAEQWVRVKDLVGLALEITRTGSDPSNLDSVLDQEDEEVRKEVKRLIEEHGKAGPFLNLPTPATPAMNPVFQAGQLVAGRYRIIERVRQGGMGEVYRADDTELGGIVALKTILPEYVGDQTALRRFKKEIAVARKVTHPNVCRVFDLDRHEDSSGIPVNFLTMEFLSGETLSDRLAREGPLRIDRAMPLVRQMAAGIDAAHRAGVIHRDLKSGNVMLTPTSEDDERAVITDFGIARELPRTETVSMITEPHQLIGTRDYMAPELFRGAQPSVASDLYAFGIVLFEMVTGRRPRNHPGDKPESPRDCVPDLESAWESVILRCLDRDPNRRFGSALAVVEALSQPPPTPRARKRRAALVGLLAIVMLAMAGIARRDLLRSLFRQIPEKKHIAVLPLSPIGSGEDIQAFAEGVTETITGKLSELEQFQKALWIVPASEVRTRKPKSVEETRKSFGVTLAITGSVQRRSETLAVIVNLVDARTLEQLESRTVELPAQSAAALQKRVIESVTGMLGIRMREDARRVLAAGQTDDPAAFQLYEEGLGFLRRFEQDNVLRAIKLFQNAVAKDPDYALAYTRLGEAYLRRYAFTRAPADVDLARLNVTRGLELKSDIPAGHAALGSIQLATGEHNDALASFERALKLDPRNNEAMTALARLYDRMGRPNDAERTYRRAIELRPDYWGAYNLLGAFYAGRAQYEQALRMFQMVAGLTPESSLGYKNIGVVSIYLGRYPEAEAALKRANEISPSAEAYSNLSVCATFQGRHEEAVHLLEKAVELNPNNDQNWRNLGDAYQQVPAQASRAQGAYRKALDAVTTRLEVNPRSTELLISSALYQAKLKNAAAAERTLTKAYSIGPLNATVTFTSAVVWELIGRRDRSLMALREAIQRGYSLEHIEKEPELSGLRNDVRFRQLLSNLPAPQARK
jgi:serine/threonine protein kinase/tetratricopeptide (TPR) repeat protein